MQKKELKMKRSLLAIICLSFIISGSLTAEEKKLKKENEYLRRQREILKKAASILAEDPQLGMR